MRETIEVSVSGAEGLVLHAAKMELSSGSNVITFLVDREPHSIVVDPWLTRVDRNRFDNESGREEQIEN